MLDVARARLDSALKSAGLVTQRSSPAGLAGNATSSLVEHANAAAESLRRQQQSALTATAAMANQGCGGDSKGKGSGKRSPGSSGLPEHPAAVSKRKAKRKQFWSGIKEHSKGKKKHRDWDYL